MHVHVCAHTRKPSLWSKTFKGTNTEQGTLQDFQFFIAREERIMYDWTSGSPNILFWSAILL